MMKYLSLLMEKNESDAGVSVVKDRGQCDAFVDVKLSESIVFRKASTLVWFSVVDVVPLFGSASRSKSARYRVMWALCFVKRSTPSHDSFSPIPFSERLVS